MTSADLPQDSADEPLRPLTSLARLFQAIDGLESSINAHVGSLGESTGYVELDATMGGFNPGDLVLLASRPGLGKTSLALNICRSIAVVSRRPVLYFSLEKSQEQVAVRFLSTVTRIDSHKLRLENLTSSEKYTVAAAVKLLSGAPIILDDSASPSIPEMELRARAVKAESGDLGLIVIDYIQLIGPRSDDGEALPPNALMRDLRGLARRLGIPVLAMSQLSREVESRANKRPVLRDIPSHELADKILFLYRDDYYFPDARATGLTEIIVAKGATTDQTMVEVMLQSKRSIDY